MLITNDSNELTSHTYYVASTERIWRSVDLELHIPYFLLTYEISDGKNLTSQTSLLWQLRDLLDFCEKMEEDDRQRPLQITLLSPLLLNGKGCWKTDNLTEIWVVKDPEKKYYSVRYVTADGQSLFEPSVSSAEAKFEYERLLFAIA